ncbi:hypothetical protein P170DRAFT_32214 [Aspergillus steynii IBT 23096]|uniref:Serine hydrolase domain-containing protein n=1 Tax=Aspergillus steynii IBT 23096 TaxID=1392250 RepID=A0A2I2GQC7_9EURO|nr:uncharacterized protein P170DRAFT_32214 [Aspergillus steynii IBT 23096]PLB55085.1 hypothetical protein P170DRAFT_32214 [Aspergillus steynii IBT 23096]
MGRNPPFEQTQGTAMHFLCLHGVGSNSQILEAQTAALRYELGDGHTYDYAEGTVPCPVDPGLATYFPTDDDCFAYFDPSRPESFATALHHLAEFLEHEGPFDGILAFSQGAQVAAALLARLQAHYPVRCAIFLSAATPDGAPILGPPTNDAGVEVPLQLPTAHVWGEADRHSDTSRMLSTLCRPEWCSPFVHSGGHAVPGGRERGSLKGAVNAIRRTVDFAEGLQ